MNPSHPTQNHSNSPFSFRRRPLEPSNRLISPFSLLKDPQVAPEKTIHKATHRLARNNDLTRTNFPQIQADNHGTNDRFSSRPRFLVDHLAAIKGDSSPAQNNPVINTRLSGSLAVSSVSETVDSSMVVEGVSKSMLDRQHLGDLTNYADGSEHAQRGTQLIGGYTGSKHSRLSETLETRIAHGDDLSALMIKGATDLRTAKLMAEEERQRCEKLENNLETVTRERDSLKSKVQDLKNKVKEIAATTSKHTAEMYAELEKLRETTSAYKRVVDDAKNATTETSALKLEVHEYTQRINNLIGEDGRFTPSHELKKLIQELHDSSLNKQKIIDIYNDRLEFLHLEFAETKQRLLATEALHLQDQGFIRKSSEELSNSGERILTLTKTVSEQHEQIQSTLVLNSKLEHKLEENERMVDMLRAELVQKDLELVNASSKHEEVSHLQHALARSEGQIEALVKDKTNLCEEIRQTEGKIPVIMAECEELRSKCNDREKLKSELNDLKTNFRLRGERIDTLEGELRCCIQARNDAREENVRIKTELELSQRESASQQQSLQVLQERLEEFKLRLSQAEIRCSDLRERLADQAILLREEKAAHGDLQDRLVLVETTFTSRLAEHKQDADKEIATLREQNSYLKAKVEELRIVEESITKNKDYSSRFNELEKRNVKAIQESSDRVLVHIKEAMAAVKCAEDTRKETDLLRSKIGRQEEECSTLMQRLEHALSEVDKEKAASAQLKILLDESKTKEAHLQSQANTLVERFENGNLNPEEKKFVAVVSRIANSTRAQEIVSKDNIIHRMGKSMKTMEERINELNRQLASSTRGGISSSTSMSTPVTAVHEKNGPVKVDLQQGNQRSLIADDLMSSSELTQEGLSSLTQSCDEPVESTGGEIKVDNTVPATATHQGEIETQDAQPWPPISNTDETKTGIKPTDGKFAKMSRNSSDDIIDFCDNGALSVSVRSKKRLVDEVEHIEDTGNDRHGRALRRQRTAGNQKYTSKVVTGTGLKNEDTTVQSGNNKGKQRKRR